MVIALEYIISRTNLILFPFGTDILGDPDINCVVELMGGVTAAKDVVFRALAARKHVVTANKALIASYLTEIQAILKENPGVQFNYEAAVCGGIPIIHTLQTAYLGDTIHKVLSSIGYTSSRICGLCPSGDGYHEWDD